MAHSQAESARFPDLLFRTYDVLLFSVGHDDAFGREDAVGGVHVEDARWKMGERGVAGVKGYHEDSATKRVRVGEQVFLFKENQTNVSNSAIIIYLIAIDAAPRS